MLGPDGKPKQVSLQLGLSDGTSTEVVGGDLTEQQQVIVGLGGDRPSASGSAPPASPRLRF